VRALPWAKTSPAFDPAKNTMYAYDLDKAKSLVQQSGLSNIEFDISWATAGYTAEYQALATIIQGDLAKIGVKTNLKPTDPPTFTQQGNGNNPPYNGMRLSAGAFAQLYEASSVSTLSRTFGYLSNLAGFYDDKFKDLVATASTEPDAAKRKQLYGQYSDFLLDVSYAMVICPYPDIDLMRPNVEGLRWTLATNVPMSEIWLS
jgi:peptide/nickel transport system substrate-binding protein